MWLYTGMSTVVEKNAAATHCGIVTRPSSEEQGWPLHLCRFLCVETWNFGASLPKRFGYHDSVWVGKMPIDIPNVDFCKFVDNREGECMTNRDS